MQCFFNSIGSFIMTKYRAALAALALAASCGGLMAVAGSDALDVERAAGDIAVRHDVPASEGDLRVFGLRRARGIVGRDRVVLQLGESARRVPPGSSELARERDVLGQPRRGHVGPI